MQHLDKPREIPIHQSANRPHLILGGDRELVLFAGLSAACLAFTLASLMGIILGLILWFISVAVLSRMGKADPMLRHAYLRHLRYRPFYLAKGHVRSQCSATPKNWR
jgi:type IV secretory pathway TrbD component